MFSANIAYIIDIDKSLLRGLANSERYFSAIFTANWILFFRKHLMYMRITFCLNAFLE